MSQLARLRPREKVRQLRQELGWRRIGYPAPAPNAAKWSVLRRYSRVDDLWIETGTFTGETTLFLSSLGREVHTIEPDPNHAARARERFRNVPNVTVHEGSSEIVLGPLLERVSGPASLWLDGHYSGPGTYKGAVDTPIVSELAAVAIFRKRALPMTVLIDDFRCFPPGPHSIETYPDKAWLVHWAAESKFSWTVEHDIFVAHD